MADITGTSKNDKRTGTADRDTFYGMGGNDDFDGRGGTDTARYMGRFAEFEIRTKGDEVEVKDKEKKGASGDEGNDKLQNVERLEFADKLVVLKDTAPVGADITRSTNEDEAVKIYVSDFASDVDGDGLVLSNLKATNGTVTQGSDGQGAYITYTPNPDYNGPAEITYTVTEKFAKQAVDVKGKAYAAKSDTGTITIDVKPVDDAPPPPVNTPPVAVSDTAITAEDVPVTIPVLANDINLDGDDLTVTATLAEGGSVAGTVDVIDNEVVFTPAENDFGEATINYTISDGTFNSSSTVTVTVTSVNDAPTVANPIPDTSAQEGAAFSFTLGEDTFADVDAGDTLTYSAALDDGSALPPWLSFDPDTLTFTGTPDNNAQGSLAVEVTARDNAGAEASDTFNIVVADTPVPFDQTFTRDVIGTIRDRVDPALQDSVTRTNAAIVREDAEGPSNPDADNYGILEFDVGDIENVVSATLRLDPNQQGANFPTRLNVYAYSGDGAVTVSDKDLGEFAGSVNITEAMTIGDNYVPVDLNEAVINDVLEGPGNWLGFRLEVPDEPGANALFFENNSGLQSQLDLTVLV